MSIHDGHRKRLKNRFIKEGLDGFEAHNVLELLLFYSCPRIDTNPLAHELIKYFGSLKAVFDAPIEELMRVPGIGENAATLIKMIPAISRRYMEDKGYEEYLNTTQKAGDFILPHFIGRTGEMAYMVCLDSKCKILSSAILSQGGINATQINVRKVVEAAIRSNATGVIVAHNHPGGVALPSKEDLKTTQKIQKSLESINVILVDHIIVADNDFVSLADSGFVNRDNLV